MSRTTTDPTWRMTTARQAIEGYATSSGTRIWYRSIGSGQPLLLLHGGPGADHTDFLPYLLPLTLRHQLILVDQRGSGRSEKAKDPRDYRLERMVEDLEAVRKCLGVRSWVVLGHSFGGMLAQAYAIRYPRVVRGLALLGTGSSARAVEADFRRILQRAPLAVRRRIRAIERTGIYTRAGEYKAAYARLTASVLRAYMEAPRSRIRHKFPAIAADVVRAMWSENSDFQVGGTLRGFDFRRKLRAFARPVLIVIGDRDLVSVNTAEETRAACPHASLVVMADSGHMMYIDEPRLFNTLLEGFLVHCSSARS